MTLAKWFIDKLLVDHKEVAFLPSPPRISQRAWVEFPLSAIVTIVSKYAAICALLLLFSMITVFVYVVLWIPNQPRI
ncbi:MAG TPA: hypothetical protein VIY49_08245 [Bryobacteraceae bacterium]